MGVCIMSACSEEFMELYPETKLNESTFYQSQKEYTLLANGCYIPMRDYEKVEHWILAEVISDNSSFQNNSSPGAVRTRGVVDIFMVTSDVVTYGNFWKMSYTGIYNCNKLVEQIENTDMTWENESLKHRCIGEALFLRALYYFNLVRQFGGVPLVLEPTSGIDAIKIKRSTEEQIYESIINDLNDAVNHFSSAKDVEENGRANWGAAISLLGKVYLTIHEYENAESMLKAVIESNRYSLLSDYADLFDPTNKDFIETIFSIQYSEGSAALANNFIFNFAPYTSGGEVTGRPSVNIWGYDAGWNQPTDDLINVFEPGDKRKDVSIKFWSGADWDLVVRDIPYCAKYKGPISAPDNRCGDNLPVIRYADVLLMYAEVLNEMGRTGEAVQFVQQVRNRAGLTNPLTNYDKADLEVLIAKERQRELCFENHRWYDLKRTGKAIEVMTEHGAREKAMKPWLNPSSYELSQEKLLAPIPVMEVELNQITQNPGY